jgi:hypothetical protein
MMAAAVAELNARSSDRTAKAALIIAVLAVLAPFAQSLLLSR